MIHRSRTITLKDNLENSRRQLFSLRKNIVKDKVLLSDLGDALPVLISLNTFAGNQYLNSAAENSFKRNKEEIKLMGEDFFDTYFYLDEFVPYNKQIEKQLDNLLKGQVISSFIHLKQPNNNDQLVFQTFTTIPYKDSFGGLIIGLTPEQLGISNKKISRIIEEDALVIGYFEAFQRLTKREKEIITLVVYGHSNPQIAEMLCISRATVETHRKNINRKLDIHSFYKLVRFAQAFDLV